MGRLEAPASWLQAVAREMRHSETAFVWDTDQEYRLRWFTPVVEVDLCGHATLAAAHTLWEANMLPKDDQVQFFTRSGLLAARQDTTWISLEFPAEPVEPVLPPVELAKGIGVPLLFVGRNRMDYLVLLENENDLRTLKPDLLQFRKLDARGTIVTAPGSGEFDFASRFFAPQVGIDEDPVCGSAHCALGPYWAQKLAKTSMTAYQASERGGVIKVKVDESGVQLAGHALTILRGHLQPHW